MDRDAIAREGRRAQALEALAFEQEREAALREQIAAVVVDEEGGRIDRDAFARLAPDDVRRVREALGHGDEVDAEENEADPFDDPEGLYVTFDDEREGPEPEEDDEISRLEHEIELSMASQRALERYLAALDVPAVANVEHE